MIGVIVIRADITSEREEIHHLLPLTQTPIVPLSSVRLAATQNHHLHRLLHRTDHRLPLSRIKTSTATSTEPPATTITAARITTMVIVTVGTRSDLVLQVVRL